MNDRVKLIAYRVDKTKNKDKVLSLLNSADVHLAYARALGYGEYQDIREEIASIKSKLDIAKYGGFIRTDKGIFFIEIRTAKRAEKLTTKEVL